MISFVTYQILLGMPGGFARYTDFLGQVSSIV
jgi:hypothetical protein